MEVINKYPENMDVRTEYKLVKSPEVKRMSDAEGSVLNIKSWIHYNDVDFKTGEVRPVLAIETEDNELFATVSATFMREFFDMVKFFGNDLGMVRVIKGRSKAGREFVTCSIE